VDPKPEGASNSSSGANAPKSAPSGREKLFAFAAVLVPTLLGCVAIVAVLVHQERLVRDRETGQWKFQKPPIYLEERRADFTGHKYLFDEYLGWRNIPSWSSETRGRPLTINSKGLRDREYTYERVTGKKRILVLGDSFTWGYGVGDRAIYTEVVERMLAEEGKDWEIINTGVSGYGTDQEYLFLMKEGLKYKPDVVMLALYLFNDPDNNCAAIQYNLGKPVFADTNLTTLIPPVLRPREPVKYIEEMNPAHITLALVDAIEKTCLENDIRFMVMMFGMYGARPNPEWINMWNTVRNGLAQRSARYPLFDLDAAFEGGNYPFIKLIENNDDGHWNAYGHEVVAKLLHRFLRLHEKPIFEGVGAE
tara:strand:- start:8206 stop:9297 length:1092 start_codon:yes stop_codon:yes gene_type:complete